MKLIISLVSFSAVVFFGSSLIHSADDENSQGKESHHHAHHKAHHGGVLNVIGDCETGHMEVRLEGDTLEAWLLGGGRETNRSVPVQAQEIPLRLTAPGQGKLIEHGNPNPDGQNSKFTWIINVEWCSIRQWPTLFPGRVNDG